MRNVELRIVNYRTRPEFTTSATLEELQQVGRVKNYEALDLYESEPLNVTLQSQDIKNPTQRRISYAGSFKLPATDKNNRLLSWSYLINSSIGRTNAGSPYDINLFNFAIKAQLYVNGFYIFDGDLQLTNITRNSNGVDYEVTFILDNQSFFTLLKDIRFGDALVTPFTTQYFAAGTTILPANWIWDSIILAKDGRTKFFPETTGSYFPSNIDKDVATFIDHTTNSWTENGLSNKHYWGFIDDGKLQVVKNSTNVRNVNDSSPILENMGVGPVTSVNAFSLFDTVRPYYYTSDIISRIFRFLEYKLNGERFGLTEPYLFNVTTINYPNYDKPDVDYPNIPIRFYFEPSEYTSVLKPKLDKLVMVTPENRNYANGKLNSVIDSSAPITSSTITFKKFPIVDDTYAGVDRLEWDEYGIAFFESKLDLGTTAVSVKYSLTFDDFILWTLTTPVDGGSVQSTKVWFGFGNYSALPARITSNLPAGYNFTNYNDLNDKIKRPTGDTNISQEDVDNAKLKWKKTFCNWEDYAQKVETITVGVKYLSTNPNFNTAYDLRRYLYPSLSEYTMSDFLIEVFRLYNVKTEQPIFKGLITQSALAEDEPSRNLSILPYNAIFNKDSQIVELTEGVNLFNIKKKQLFYKDFTIKYAENADSLSKLYTDSFSPAIPFGSKYVNFNQIEGYAQDSLEIELKCGVPTFIPALKFIKADGYNWSVPSVFNITNIGTGEEYKADVVETHPIFFLYNNGDELFTSTAVVTIVKQLGPKRINTTALGHNLPILSPFIGASTIDPNSFLLYDTPFSQLRNNFNRSFGFADNAPRGYEVHYQDEINSLQGSDIIKADINLSLIELFNIRFDVIYAVRINGEFAYYRLNKLSNYDLGADGLAKIELIEFDYITGNNELYSKTITFTSDNETKTTDNTTSVVNVNYGSFGTTLYVNNKLRYERFRDFTQYVKLRAAVGSILTFTNGTINVNTVPAETTDTETTYKVVTTKAGGLTVTKVS
jgi:hypothetical protein